MNIDKLTADLMNIPCERTLSHFATTHEAKAYGLGHRDARHAAVEVVLEHAKESRAEISDDWIDQIVAICWSRDLPMQEYFRKVVRKALKTQNNQT